MRAEARRIAKEAGKCTDCPRKAKAGFTRCARHRKLNNALSLAHYHAGRE